ncbi:MAG: sigma 54-interacting transcriptional regulator [Erysipelotrichaceae bacterium]|nr:sigma 54-interacting transcriptional regulator [Erysipelotrichaceae bacterium]
MKSKKEIVLSYLYNMENKDNSFKGLTTTELSKALNMQRSNASSILNTLVKEKKVIKYSGKPVIYRVMNNDNIDKELSFNKLIGNNDSLKNAVQLAKAAILYPENSINALLIGEAGSGLSYFASLMYEFALEQEIITSDAPFIKFNCSFYANNEEEQIKGLFEIDSSFDTAKNGVLFINHIDLLTPSVKKRLFEAINSEKYKNIILICSINSNTRHITNDVFYKNFPIHIEIPSLVERPLKERLELVEHFFLDEAEKMNKEIRINSELLRCFLLYSCLGNVKQLKNDIKIGCANAFVRELNSNTDSLRVFVNDCHSYVRKGFIFYRRNREQIEALIPDNYTYTFTRKRSTKKEESIINIENHNSIYEVIERKAKDLKERKIRDEDIMTIVSADLESDFLNMKRHLEVSGIDRSILKKVVDQKIIDFVEIFLKEASTIFRRIFPASTFYGICIQLQDSMSKTKTVQNLSNDKIMEIIENHKEEYTFSSNYMKQFEKEFDTVLSIDEIILITMFILEEDEQIRRNQPVVLIAMHGSIASSIVNTVNMIYKNQNVHFYDLLLDKDINEAYEDLKNQCKQIDNNRGILVIYDMGSIRTMLESIALETGLQIKMIEIPITMIVLDCAIKLSSAETIDSVYDDVVKRGFGSFPSLKEEYKRLEDGKKVIITLCRTGEGSALQIKQYLEMNLQLSGVDIIALAVGDPKILVSELNKRQKKQEILCIVGTYDPKLHNIPFISIAKIFDTPVDKLPMLLALKDVDVSQSFDYSAMYEYLDEQLPKVNLKKLKRYLPKVLRQISGLVDDFTINEEVGLFMHIACSINRLKLNEALPVNIHKEKVILNNKKLYHKLKEILSPFEQEMEVEFNDDELATIIEIII